MNRYNEIVKKARDFGCSDVHLTINKNPFFRKDGDIFESPITLEEGEVEEIILSMLDERQKKLLDEGHDLDFANELPSGERQRINIYKQAGHLAAAIRLLNNFIPTFEDLNLPEVIKSFAEEPRGLVLITGPTGSGKSTTLAAMIDHINQTRKGHIVTIEDPVEYVHRHKQSIVHQRELGADTPSFASALRSSLREDPDVILVGEMRDLETIAAAVTAAETGHLVLSTLHTTGASSTVDRIIDVFPPHSQGQIRIQLAGVLKGIVSQQLVPLAAGEGRVAAFEILVATDGILNQIREGKTHHLTSSMQTSGKTGMCTLNRYLAQLVKAGLITREEAFKKTDDKKDLESQM